MLSVFMGAFDAKRQDMYSAFQHYGYVLVFREHGINLKGKKKGNVDVDIVFEMMRDAHTNAHMKKAILVSGDGDYRRVVDHLITIQKFERVLFPGRKNASSLYRDIPEENKAYLDAPNVKKKIGRQQKGGFA